MGSDFAARVPEDIAALYAGLGRDLPNPLWYVGRLDERGREVPGAQIIGGDLARHGAWRKTCDSCGRASRLTYSPLHDAHFCPECLEREVPDPGSLTGESR